MTTLLLSAGKATRLGDRAPKGCKALNEVDGQTMLDHWLSHDPDTVIACAPEHVTALPSGVDVVIVQGGGGPAAALREALPYADFPVTVAYADTWVKAVPDAEEFCGIAAAKGGRRWDVHHDSCITYRYVAPDVAALVCIGLYRFADHDRLAKALDVAIEMAGDGEAGMADVVNVYGLPFVPVLGWQDVGDPAALEAWRPL